MSRTRVLAAVAGSLVVAAALWILLPGLVVPREPVAGPSVVLVMIDTLRADRIGASGDPRPTSPRLDALARGGVRMSRFFSTSSWTRPGVATLVTGRYARSVGVYEERYDVLPDEATTLAERLHGAGWLTLGVTANPNINAWFGFDQGFDAWVDSEVVFKFMEAGPGEARFGRKRHPLVPADRVTDRVVALLAEHAREARERPFYLQVLYIDPHFPYDPPPEHLAAVGGGERLEDRYDGEVHFADAEVGRLLDALEDGGYLRDTLVVVTSDHGEGLSDHPGVPGSSTHGYTLYDSVLHVPFLAAHPDLTAGRVVDDLGSAIDLVPSVLDWLGLPPDPTLPGVSLVPAWRGQGSAERDRVFAETDWRFTRKVAVRSAGALVIRNHDAAALAADGTHEGSELSAGATLHLQALAPTEAWRRPGPPAGPGSAAVPLDADAEAAWLAALDAWEASTPARPPENHDPEDVITLGGGTVVGTPGEGTAREPDPATAAQLRALGYLDEGSR